MDMVAAAQLRSNPPPGHVDVMLSSFTVLLGARRLIAHRAGQRPTSTGGFDLDVAWREVDRVADTRERWAMALPVTEPDFWISAYARLLSGYEGVRNDLLEHYDLLDWEPRQRVVNIELPALEEEIADCRRRLQEWQRIGLEPLPPEASVGP